MMCGQWSPGSQPPRMVTRHYVMCNTRQACRHRQQWSSLRSVSRFNNNPNQSMSGKKAIAIELGILWWTFRGICPEKVWHRPLCVSQPSGQFGKALREMSTMWDAASIMGGLDAQPISPTGPLHCLSIFHPGTAQLHAYPQSEQRVRHVAAMLKVRGGSRRPALDPSAVNPAFSGVSRVRNGRGGVVPRGEQPGTTTRS
jgi:hypothetical protein